MTREAMPSPTATPSVFPWPAGIVASDAAYAGSRIVERLSRQVVNENLVGSRGHRRLGRGTRGRVDVDREGPIPALHRQHRVVDRNRHVREDHVALGRRQPRRTKRLRCRPHPNP